MLGLALPWLLPAVIAAQTPEATLQVRRETGAEGCASGAALEHEVSAILRREIGTDARGADIALAVTFTRGADGSFLAHVDARGKKSGQRRLHDTSSSCDALSQAVAVAIALLLDSAEIAESPTPPADDAGAAPPPTEARDAPGEPASAPPGKADSRSSNDSDAWRTRALAGGGVAYGLGGSGTVYGSAAFGLSAGHIRLELGALATLPARTDYRGGNVQTSLVFGSLRGCYLIGGAFALGPCLELGLGRLRGEGSGFERAEPSSLFWSAGGLGLRAEVSLSDRLFLALGTTLWVPGRRQTFSVQNAGIAWESKPVAGGVSAGVGVALF